MTKKYACIPFRLSFPQLYNWRHCSTWHWHSHSHWHWEHYLGRQNQSLRLEIQQFCGIHEHKPWLPLINDLCLMFVHQSGIIVIPREYHVSLNGVKSSTSLTHSSSRTVLAYSLDTLYNAGCLSCCIYHFMKLRIMQNVKRNPVCT